jgi:hypothetical protein
MDPRLANLTAACGRKPPYQRFPCSHGCIMTKDIPSITAWETSDIRCMIGIEPEESRWIVTLVDKRKNRTVLQLSVALCDDAITAADGLRDTSLSRG